MESKALIDIYECMQNNDENRSLSKKHLIKEFIDQYGFIRTPFGGTLSHCVNAKQNNGLNPTENLPRCVDPECYTTFSGFFDSILKDCHKFAVKKISHPKANFGNASKLGFSDLNRGCQIILSTKVQLKRNIYGFPFVPLLSKDDKLHLERQVSWICHRQINDYIPTYIFYCTFFLLSDLLNFLAATI
ncbi:unnamed protein product [Protopolystoma xenopodis]|uniref:Uncharacterized protein n=1 Tax=Protopolystoma xenopodis TaxID=117903 RepID=A0A3S5ANH1_9PLAT|nr:unnamed protein product [Protopolystoma xenopodis]